MGIEVQSQPLVQRRRLVGHMIVGDALKAMLAQGCDHGVGVGAAHLMRRDRFARLDQLIAGRDHHDRRLAADAHPRHAGRGGDRDLRCVHQRAGTQQQRTLGLIAAAPVHELPGRQGIARLDLDEPVGTLQSLDRHDQCRSRRAAPPRS